MILYDIMIAENNEKQALDTELNSKYALSNRVS